MSENIINVLQDTPQFKVIHSEAVTIPFSFKVHEKKENALSISSVSSDVHLEKSVEEYVYRGPKYFVDLSSEFKAHGKRDENNEKTNEKNDRNERDAKNKENQDKMNGKTQGKNEKNQQKEEKVNEKPKNIAKQRKLQQKAVIQDLEDVLSDINPKNAKAILSAIESYHAFMSQPRHVNKNEMNEKKENNTEKNKNENKNRNEDDPLAFMTDLEEERNMQSEAVPVSLPSLPKQQIPLFSMDPYIPKLLNAELGETLLLPILSSFTLTPDSLCLCLRYAACHITDMKLFSKVFEHILLRQSVAHPKDQMVHSIKKLTMPEIRIILKFLALHWHTTPSSMQWVDAIITGIPKLLIQDEVCVKQLAKISHGMKKGSRMAMQQLHLLGPLRTILSQQRLPEKNYAFQYKIFAIPKDSNQYYESKRQ